MAIRCNFDVARMYVDYAAKERGQRVGILRCLEDW